MYPPRRYNYVSTLGNGYILWNLLNFICGWVSPYYAEIQKGGLGVGISQKHNIAGIDTLVGGRVISMDKYNGIFLLKWF
jgi:hypothetical protein